MPFMIFWKVRQMMKNDLTIAKIKHTDFAELYDKFIIGKKLNQKQYETLLAIAICFTNADDINVQQWGYRIVVEYCNQTQDYMPLYEIAINKGLYPVSKFIERHYIDDDQRNFFTEWNDAFTEQYISGDICRSEQQDALIKFFEKKYNNTISISAPTSYGKSELILSTIKEYKGRKICVLTSTKALLTQTKKRIQQISKGIFPKVVVHPEMYNSKDVSCLAVLTQERLLRVLKKDPALAFALDLAAVLPEVKSEIIQRACDNIAEYLQPQYNLITCLRKGIIYHHGSVPDAIRIYIEDLYKENEAIKYVITSSTLLSGVNLPAERMFILDNRRGRSNLSHDSFKNLVGRVCRFNEIFNNDSGTLQRLEPQIYLVFGRYFARNANCENFLCNVAKAEKKYQDEVENVLLSQTKITEVNKEELRHASEFIENYENGAVENYKERYIDTTFGKACIMNGANEIDVFKYENEIQQQVSKYQHENLKINDSTKLLEIINELFIKYLPENGTDSLRRLSNKEARKFYAMMFEWRVENKSYSEMISLFFGYWHQLYRKNRNVSFLVDFDRDISWKRLLRIQSNEKHGTYKTRRKMLMDLINDPLFDINDIGGGLINICNRDIGKITNWRKYFISVPGVMDALHDYSAYKPKERYIRIEGDNIFLMGSTRLYGYNKEYYSFALCCMLECLGKYSVRYEDAKGWEDIHHQIEVTEKSTGEVYEIKYRRSEKKFSIYKKDGSATVYANLEDTFNALK